MRPRFARLAFCRSNAAAHLPEVGRGPARSGSEPPEAMMFGESEKRIGIAGTWRAHRYRRMLPHSTVLPQWGI
jgi:hypothetical protein